MENSKEYKVLYQQAVQAVEEGDLSFALELLSPLRWSETYSAMQVHEASIFRETILKELQRQNAVHYAEIEGSSLNKESANALKNVLKINSDFLREEIRKKSFMYHERLFEELMMQNYYELTAYPERHPNGVIKWEDLPTKNTQLPDETSHVNLEASLSQKSLGSMESAVTLIPDFRDQSVSPLNESERETPMVSQEASDYALSFEEGALTPKPVSFIHSTQNPSFDRLHNKAKEHELRSEFDDALAIYQVIIQQDNYHWRTHKALIELTILKQAPVNELLAVCNAFLAAYREKMPGTKSKKDKMQKYYLDVLTKTAMLTFDLPNGEEQCIELLEEAARLKPNKDTIYYLASAYKNKIFIDRAQYALLKDSSTRRKTTQIVLNDPGLNHELLVEKAINSYQRAAELGHPWNTSTYSFVINFYTQVGHYETAIAYCDQLIEQVINNPANFYPGFQLFLEYRRALFYIQLNDYQHALNALEIIMRKPTFNVLFPLDVKGEFYFDLGRVQEQLGLYNEALVSFCHAVQNDSMNVAYYLAIQRVINYQKQVKNQVITANVNTFLIAAKQLVAFGYFNEMSTQGIELILESINDVMTTKEKKAYLLCIAGFLCAKELKKPQDALGYFQLAEAIRPLHDFERSTYEKIAMVIQKVGLFKTNERVQSVTESDDLTAAASLSSK